MSKYLVKILSVCAIVVLMCVTIVGAAICAAEAVGCTLTVAELGIDGKEQKSAEDITIIVDGKKYKDKVTVAKYTEVVVEYYRPGYVVSGFYEGQYNVNEDKPVKAQGEIDETAADAWDQESRLSYTFEITKNTKITAQDQAKEFTVRYVYNNAPNHDFTYKYNDKLEECPSELLTGEKHFEGWRICDEAGAFTKADAYENATFNEKSGANIYLAPSFGEEIEYTVNIKFSAIDAGSEAPIKFKPLNTAKDLAYAAPTRLYYTLAGAIFNGKTYTYDKNSGAFIDLSKEIIRNNVLEVEITLVWQADFRGYTFNFRGVAKDVDGDYMGVYDNTNTLVTVDDVMATFVDQEGEQYFDLKDDVFTKYIKPFIDSKGPIKTEITGGKEVTFAKQVLYTVGGTDINAELFMDPQAAQSSLTFGEILSFLKEQGKLPAAATQITVYFIFA